MAFIAILSDIPLYLATLISELTGADMSGFIDMANGGFAAIIEAFEKLAGFIG
ncbi:MAG: hypothetical protein J6B52_01215 [Clostridia bacterium]|nr:hypothetical protein [Clostridia bacterium]